MGLQTLHASDGTVVNASGGTLVVKPVIHVHYSYVNSSMSEKVSVTA